MPVRRSTTISLPCASRISSPWSASPQTGERDRLNNRNTYGPTLDVKWDFFPHTAVVFHTHYDLNRWGQNSLDSLDGALGDISVPNSSHFKATLGLEGRFTAKLYADLILGYGFALYDEASVAGAVAAAAADLSGIDGLLVKTQLRYRITPETEASVGYRRDFTDSFFTNYVTYDHLYAQFAANIADIRPRIRYSLRFEGYEGQVTRNDVVNSLDLGADYDFRKWGQVNAGFNWTQRAIAEQIYQDAEYDEFRFDVGATFTY